MGSSELLHRLRGAGLVLTLTQDGGGLRVAPRDALTDDHRGTIRAERQALMLALQAEGLSPLPPPLGRSGNLLMASDQHGDSPGSDCDDSEIASFTAREARFTRHGRPDAEHLAERLKLRDREGDDRRLCLECTWLGDRGRCMAAAAGRIRGADRRLESVQTILQRCEAFGLRKGLV